MASWKTCWRSRTATPPATHSKKLRELQAIKQDYMTLDRAGKDRMLFPYITLRRGILGEQAWRSPAITL